MKIMARVILVATVVCVSTAAFAQKSTQELLREIETSNRAAQLEMEQSRLRWQKMEADTARRHAEIERLHAETDHFLMWNESQKAADRAREMVDRAEQAVSEQAKASKKAEEAAEELRDEMEQAEVRAKNNIYLVVLFFFTAAFVTYIIRKSKREEIMQERQKFGIVAIVGSALVIILAIMISDDWVYRFDFLQNLMSSLRIKLFADEDKYNAYFIDVPTKYIVLACICTAAYGLTTYLGITPVPKMKAQKTDGTGTDITL